MRTYAYATAAAVAAVGLSAAAASGAGFVRAPLSSILNTAGEFGPGFELANTWNQSGLSAGYTAGVTDFDAYMGGGPVIHSLVASTEWFSPSGVTGGVVIYDMGASYQIDRMAFWNEDAGGIDSVVIDMSNDPAFGSFTSFGTFFPTDHPVVDYPADIFSFGAGANARYVRMTLLADLTPDIGVFTSIGEVAFSTVVPEPASLAGLLGLAGVAALRRRR